MGGNFFEAKRLDPIDTEQEFLDSTLQLRYVLN